MNYRRLVLAATTAWITDAAYAFAVWTSWIGDETARFPAVFRPDAEVIGHMPLMFAGSLLAMFALTFLYARSTLPAEGLAGGFKFGLALAVFMLGFVSVAIYAAFSIDTRLAALGFAVNVVEMLIVGVVIGAVYRIA